MISVTEAVAFGGVVMLGALGVNLVVAGKP